MHLMRYSYTFSHVPGKQLTVADMLSPALLLNSSDHTDFSNEVDAYANNYNDSVHSCQCNKTPSYQRGTSSRLNMPETF